MLGCLIPVAVVFSIFGFLGSFADPTLSFLGRIALGAMTGGMAFVASFLLCIRDRSVFRKARRRMHVLLTSRGDVDCSVFCHDISLDDEELVLDIRQAVADFFDVPPAKIYGSDTLATYQYSTFEPGFHTFVIGRVLAKRNRNIGFFCFPEKPVKDLRDFVREIQRVVAISQPR
jgi:hypothetical protein